MVERAPRTSGHARTVASETQAQNEVAQGRFAGTSTPSFRVAEGDKVIQGDDVVDFGGNLRKWRSQLEELNGEVDWAFEIVYEA